MQPAVFPLLMTLALATPAMALACPAEQPQRIVPCYIEGLRATPVQYQLMQVQQRPDHQWRRYTLNSQHWAPSPVTTPQQWQHDVQLYLPANAVPGKVLLVVNNGIRHGGGQQRPDYDDAVLQAVALNSNSVVAVLNDVPNQSLSFADAAQPMIEDYAVAHTWAHWLRAPTAEPTLPLHVPMAGAISRAMDLVSQELGSREFVLTGASKRGWAAWLTTLGDERVIAVVPAVIDVLGTTQMLEGLNKRLGGAWPAALWPYERAGVLQQHSSPPFQRLMGIMDPLSYLGAPGNRLSVPKYMVSASGDDFFAPDAAGSGAERLPGQTSLRVLPNSDHGGVREHIETTLVPLMKRLQAGHPLPSVELTTAEGAAVVTLSEAPVAVRLWQAHNPRARDFRYACGIRYTAQTWVAGKQQYTVTVPPPAQGWAAWYLEARFTDGFVATTPVTVAPQTFPDTPPPDQEGACRVFPG